MQIHNKSLNAFIVSSDDSEHRKMADTTGFSCAKQHKFFLSEQLWILSVNIRLSGSQSTIQSGKYITIYINLSRKQATNYLFLVVTIS